jgi:ribosomal protein S18 acetylase RimI-like enzyme
MTALQDPIRISRVDYADPIHAQALVALLDAYARDPMGGGAGLSDYAKTHVVAGLASRAQAFSVLAFAPDASQTPVGLVNCIEGFSTFAAKPLVNVHDVIVLPDWRGQGVAGAMLEEVIQIARERGGCKLTLEVLSGNQNALRAYAKLGFDAYQLDPEAGTAQFLQMWLDADV